MDQSFTRARLKTQVATSIFALTIRKVILQFILTLTNVILVRIFTPHIFGAFAIINFLTISFGLFSDFGLGPAIVQKKGRITDKELQAIFTLIIMASLFFVGAIFVGAPFINLLYQGKLEAAGVFWLRLYAVSVLIDHLATIPIHLLQRKLDFPKIAVGELVTSFITQIFTVVLALKGFGVGAFVWGAIAGKIIQAAVFYALNPWRVGINFSLNNLKQLLPFGLNYQVNTLIGAFNSAVIPGFVGAVVGTRAVGFITWAGGVRQAALAPIDVVEKLLFSAASRVQDRQELLKSLLEKILRLSCLMAFPLLTLVGVLAPQLITFVFTDKWLPGLMVLYLSLIQGVFILLGLILNDALLALGEAKAVRNITLFWAVMQWVLSVPLVLWWNYSGVVVAGIVVSATFFIPLIKLRRRVEFSFWPNVIPYFLYAGVMGVITYVLSLQIRVVTIWQFFLLCLFGTAFYFGCLIIFEKEKLRDDVQKLKELLGQS